MPTKPAPPASLLPSPVPESPVAPRPPGPTVPEGPCLPPTLSPTAPPACFPLRVHEGPFPALQEPPDRPRGRSPYNPAVVILWGAKRLGAPVPRKTEPTECWGAPRGGSVSRGLPNLLCWTLTLWISRSPSELPGPQGQPPFPWEAWLASQSPPGHRGLRVTSRVSDQLRTHPG